MREGLRERTHAQAGGDGQRERAHAQASGDGRRGGGRQVMACAA